MDELPIYLIPASQTLIWKSVVGVMCHDHHCENG